VSNDTCFYLWVGSVTFVLETVPAVTFSNIYFAPYCDTETCRQWAESFSLVNDPLPVGAVCNQPLELRIKATIPDSRAYLHLVTADSRLPLIRIFVDAMPTPP